MNKEEFRKLVIAEAKKYLFSNENELPTESTPVVENKQPEPKAAEPTINASEIKKLAEEMKKINKKIDLRNPLISESDESLVESIINKNRERYLDVDDINKNKHINFQTEGEKDKWNRMLNYNVPKDEERA